MKKAKPVKKAVSTLAHIVVLCATIGAVYMLFVSVAAQPTSIRISETVMDMGSGKVTSAPATEFKERTLDITRQVAGDLAITFSLSNGVDYTVISSGVINSGTITLLAAQNTLSVSVRFHPSQESIRTGILTITQGGASVTVKLSGRGVRSGTSPLCPSSYFPAVGARDMPTSLILQWPPASDPDGGAVSYKVYLDDDKNVTTHADGIGAVNVVKSGADIVNTGSSFTTTLTSLSPKTGYYWIVEVTDDEGSKVQCPRGSLLSFVTQGSVSGTSGLKYEFPTEVIQFDPRILYNPPPGFTDERFRLPQTTEVIPN